MRPTVPRKARIHLKASDSHPRTCKGCGPFGLRSSGEGYCLTPRHCFGPQRIVVAIMSGERQSIPVTRGNRQSRDLLPMVLREVLGGGGEGPGQGGVVGAIASAAQGWAGRLLSYGYVLLEVVTTFVLVVIGACSWPPTRSSTAAASSRSSRLPGIGRSKRPSATAARPYGSGCWRSSCPWRLSAC